MNFIKEQLKIWQLKRNLREITRPDRAFLKSARERFIILAQQGVGVQIRVARHSSSFRYATVAIVTVLSMTSGLSVFADANNVSATHPLYNLKRVSEQVRLGLSSPAQQVELHRVFAHRRLEEASELENENSAEPVSAQIENQPQTKTQIPAQSQLQNKNQIQNRINNLNKDFQNETEGGLNQAQKVTDRPEVRTEFCDDILNTVENKLSGRKLPSHMIDRIKSRCDNRETIEEDSEFEDED